MSVNIPPNPNVSTFNNLYWIQADDALTTGEADLRYLKFPIAQGTESLKAINVTGAASFTGGMTSTTETTYNIAGGRIITCNDGAYNAKIRIHPYNSVGLNGGQVAIGSTTAATAAGVNAIAIGTSAGATSQSNNAVAIGFTAGPQ